MTATTTSRPGFDEVRVGDELHLEHPVPRDGVVTATTGYSYTLRTDTGVDVRLTRDGWENYGLERLEPAGEEAGRG